MKKGLLIFCILVISLPFFSGWFKADKEPSFFGEQLTMGQTIYKFTFSRWLNDVIQKRVEEAAVYNTGYHNFLIRLSNELNYRILVQPKAFAIVSGKSGYLFEENYLNEYTGKIFCGEDFLRKKIKYLKIVQDFLLKEKGIYLIPVLEPGIVSYNSDYIPMNAIPRADGRTNYKALKESIKKSELKIIDLEDYFSTQIKPSPYQIFPKRSLHWGEYACYLAADTLFKFSSKMMGKPLPSIILDSVYASQTPNSSENEVEKSMRLLSKLPASNYSHVALRFDTAGKYRPHALFVADSYFFMYGDIKVTPQLFSDHTFWYYNTTVHPFSEGPNAVWIKNLNFKEEIEKYPVIFLMANELNYYRMYWNFVEKTMQAYGIDSLMDENYMAKNFILNNKTLFSKLLAFSNLYKIPFEISLENMAQMIILAKHNPKDYRVSEFWSIFFSNDIYRNKNYIEELRETAEKNHTSLEKEIYNAALWVLDQDIIKASYY